MGAFGFQQKNYDCGLHAFRNAMQVYSVEISYDDAKRLVGTTSRYGTSKAGIIRGISELGFRATEYSTKNELAAWRWLLKWSETCAVIALVDNRQHWTTITGRIKNRVIMIDPTANLGKGENGAYVLDREDMLWRWHDKQCYAIRIWR
jgi:ABC-type bacteriocin/lantibiotic exporter with double-glycine peptidase domain